MSALSHSGSFDSDTQRQGAASCAREHAPPDKISYTLDGNA